MQTIVVYSFDPGSVNFAITKVCAKVNPKDITKYYGICMEWARVITSKYETEGGIITKNSSETSDESEDSDNETQTDLCLSAQAGFPKFNCKWTKRKTIQPPKAPLQILKSYEAHLMTGNSMELFRQEIKQMREVNKKCKINILIEPQIDQHINSFKIENHDLFITTYLVLSREEMCGENLNFVEWNGNNKSGLEGKHGKERKNETAKVAINLLRLEGFEAQAKFIESLPSIKPREDVADAYLQARNYLLRTLAKAGYAVPDANSGLIGKTDLLKTKKKSDKFLLDSLPKPVPEKGYSIGSSKKSKKNKLKRKADKEPKISDLDDSDSAKEPPKKKRKILEENPKKKASKKKNKRSNQGKNTESTTTTTTTTTKKGQQPQLVSITIDEENSAVNIKTVIKNSSSKLIDLGDDNDE